MGFQNFISEHEAIAVTGMSATTLGRFAEAGYLQIETDPDGLRLYSRDELEKLFGIKSSVTRVQPSPKAEPQAASSTTQATAATTKAETIRPSNPSAFPQSSSEPTQVTFTSPGSPPSEMPGTAATPSTRAYELLELENTRLKNLIELQEKILDLKDKEVADLKGQRDWLKARVEKLEDKSDRDQVLILSETQTIRSLISLQQAKRSPVRLALEWLGFADPGQQEQADSGRKSAIEVDRAA
ncbi:MAG: hypothetical protein K1X79_04385 [Oligoflexia bacterium]|nr:hypothetical protein [Oligoflexia bacterium]